MLERPTASRVTPRAIAADNDDGDGDVGSEGGSLTANADAAAPLGLHYGVQMFDKRLDADYYARAVCTHTAPRAMRSIKVKERAKESAAWTLETSPFWAARLRQAGGFYDTDARLEKAFDSDLALAAEHMGRCGPSRMGASVRSRACVARRARRGGCCASRSELRVQGMGTFHLYMSGFSLMCRDAGVIDHETCNPSDIDCMFIATKGRGGGETWLNRHELEALTRVALAKYVDVGHEPDGRAIPRLLSTPLSATRLRRARARLPAARCTRRRPRRRSTRSSTAPRALPAYSLSTAYTRGSCCSRSGVPSSTTRAARTLRTRR